MQKLDAASYPICEPKPRRLPDLSTPFVLCRHAVDQAFGGAACLNESHAFWFAWSNALRDWANAALSAVQDSLPACFNFCKPASASAACAFICLAAASTLARFSAAILVAASWNLSAASRQAFTWAAAMSRNMV